MAAFERFVTVPSMIKITNGALFFLAAGILTSVTILSAYQILFTLAVVYFTYLAFKEKNFQLPVSAYWLLTFAVVALISTLINIDIIPKPSKNLGRIKYFLYGVTGIYVFRFWLKDATLKTKTIIMNTFLLSIVVAGVYATGRYLFTDDERATPLTETMRYGYGSAMLLLTLLSAFLHKDKMGKWFQPQYVLLALIIGFFGMFFTYTRGALLGFLCGLPFVFFFYRKKVALIGGALSILVVLTLAIIYFFGTGTSSIRFLSTQNNASDNIRRSQWQSAVIAIQEKPVLGWGLSNFHTQLKRIKTQNDLAAKHYDDAHSHNVFLEVGAGTGLIGLFIFCGWLIAWAIECFKAGGLVRALVIPFGAAFVTSSQFEVTLDANNASMIFTVYSLSAAYYSSNILHPKT